jgi:hypothetical protein
MMRLKNIFVVALLAAALLSSIPARADLTITPVRIVFGVRDRTATLSLLNVTDKTNTYRMSWLLMKADEHGQYTLVHADDKDPHGVANMVIFTPRQVTIEPHGYQSIRLSLRRPADLPPGEYRAHLALTRLANPVLARKPDPNEKGKNVSLSVNLSFSIPVIVRQGEDKDLKISLSSPKLGMSKGAKPRPTLYVDINRDAGKFSSYGVVKVLWQPPTGKEQEIGLLNNVALYPEVQTRHIDVALTENPTAGSVRVVYLGKYESEGTTWAEKSFSLGK